MRHSLSDLSPGQTWLLILLVITALLAGLGLREPMPADEPRFVLAAKTMGGNRPMAVPLPRY